MDYISQNLIQEDKDNRSSCAKLILPESAQHISRHISDIVYNSLSSQNIFQKNQRLDVLTILHKWCINGLNHYQISHRNYDCIVNSLINIANPLIIVDNDLLLNNVIDDHVALNLDGTQLVIDYYRKLTSANNEKSKKLEIINTRDCYKWGGSNLFDVNYSRTFEHAKSLYYFNDLKLLNNQNHCLGSTSNTVRKSCNQKQLRTTESKDRLREKQISLGYLILRLDKASNKILLLSNILRNLGSHETLKPNEIDFVNHVWHNYEKLDLPQEVPHLLLENFSFIYEKYFINMCTSVLRKNTTAISEDVSKILKLIENNETVCCNVENLLLELYACSRYSSKLCTFLTLIN